MMRRLTPSSERRPSMRPRRRRARGARGSTATLSALALLMTASAAHGQAILFVSPADDGTPITTPLALPVDASASLHLYWIKGFVSSSVPSEVCVSGDGDEVCATRISIRTEGAITISDFVPESTLDVAFTSAPSTLEVHALDALAPTPGLRRLGELVVNVGSSSACAPTPCLVVVDAFEFVAADLSTAPGILATSGSTIAVPEPASTPALVLGVLGLALLRSGRRSGHRPRRSAALALVAALVLAPPVAAQIVTLPAARYITQCDESPQQDLPVANSSFCDNPQVFVWNGSQGTSIATTEAVVSSEAFSSRPRLPKGIPLELALRLEPLLQEPFVAIAFVQAAAAYEATGPLQPPPPGFGASQIDGQAAVESSFVVRQTATPPVAVPAVPLVLRVRGEITVSGAGNNRATMRVTLNGDPEDSFEFTTPAGGFYSVDSEFPGEFFTIEEDQTFIKQVLCSAEARWPVGNGFCSAVLDPLINFDQATADAILGANTFPLADYFEIEYSGNLNVDGPANVCGDVTLDDFVATDDLDALRQHLLGAAPLSAMALDRCATWSGSTGCDLSDSVVLARTVAAGAAPRPPGIAPVCAEVSGGE